MGSTGESGLKVITDTFPTITEGVTSIWDMITANPVLALFVGVSVVGCFVGIFIKIKGAAQ